jgi:hypothetical protein
MQSGMLQANALKSIGYTDTVLFRTTGKPDIYQHRSLGKSATVFYPGNQKIPKLAADLPDLFCDRNPAYQYPATLHLPHYQYPIDFRCICKRHSYLLRKKVSFLH